MRRLTAVLGALTLLLAMLAAGALPASAAPTTLKEAAAAKGLVFGAAVSQSHMGESAYVNTLDREFSQLTPENSMKWETTEPSRNSFDFSTADQLVSHAQSQDMAVRGHVLVWHSQLPDWVANISSRTELLDVMRNHVSNVAGHYRGDIDYWDVVNEAFQDGSSGARRDTIFQSVIGDDYIEQAFRAARAADPGAELCYNDYNIDGINAKSDAVYAMVKDFKRRGVPIDCVGLQGHLIVGSVPGDIQANIQRFVDLGVNVYITELDIRMQTPPDSSKLAQQAADYRRVVSACVAVQGCGGITVWGVTDKYSWIPDVFEGEGAALLFDENYDKKPAYDATLEALSGGVTCTYTPVVRWRTGFIGKVTVTAGSTAVSSWTASMTMNSGQDVWFLWNGRHTENGDVVTVKPVRANSNLPPGETTSFWFIASAWNRNVSDPAVACDTP